MLRQGAGTTELADEFAGGGERWRCMRSVTHTPLQLELVLVFVGNRWRACAVLLIFDNGLRCP
jgi:hypothetical protein